MTHYIRNYWFPVLVAFIASVSIYDVLLIVKFCDFIELMEQNPAGVFLIELANGDVGVFVRAKLAGTLIVVSVLVAMHRRQSNKTLPVTTSIAAYQMWLLGYLTIA